MWVANPKGSVGGTQPRADMLSDCLRPQPPSPFKQEGLNPLIMTDSK